MKGIRREVIFALGLASFYGWSFSAPELRAQAPGNQSNYVFRFNTGVSGVFLSSMAFPKVQPLDLGECRTDERVNGPLSCAVNCEGQNVCLLEVSGPSGSNVNDVLELVSEQPLNQGAPLADWTEIQRPLATDTNARISLYNGRGRQE